MLIACVLLSWTPDLAGTWASSETVVQLTNLGGVRDGALRYGWGIHDSDLVLIVSVAGVDQCLRFDLTHSENYMLIGNRCWTRLTTSFWPDVGSDTTWTEAPPGWINKNSDACLSLRPLQTGE
jgi:hypothetical protein